MASSWFFFSSVRFVGSLCVGRQSVGIYHKGCKRWLMVSVSLVGLWVWLLVVVAVVMSFE